MNIPKNVQEYINSLPPNQQKAAMNEIMRNQYSAYKNSPNQVNQQNMKTPIAPQAAASPELALPSKYSQEREQESGNLQGNLQDMLVQYFEKMQFTEEQAKQFMQEFAKLSDEEKQQLVQELQQEIQGDSMPEQSQEMPQEEMQEQSMMSGGRFPYMLKKKSKEKLQVGGKKVVKLDDGENNDYYEVAIKADNSLDFDNKVKLDAAKKAKYTGYSLDDAEETPLPTKNTYVAPKNTQTNIAKAASTKPKQPVANNSADKAAIMQLQKNVNSLFNLDIKEDGIIGPETRGAIANLDITEDKKQAIYNQFPQLKTSATKVVSTTNKPTPVPKIAPNDTSAQTKAQAVTINSKGVKVPSAVTLEDGTTIAAPTKKAGQSAESWDETIDRWQDYLTGLETAGVGLTIGAGATGIGLPAVPFIAGATKAIGTLTGLSNVLQGAYHYYNDDDYTKANKDMSEGAVQFLAPRVLTQGLKQVGKYGTMAAKSPAVQKIFAEVKPNVLTTVAKNESKPVLKIIDMTEKALPTGKTVPITVPVKEVVKELPASKIVKELPAGKVKPTSGVKIVPSSGKTIIVPPKTPAPTTVLKTLPPSSTPVPKLLPAGKAPVSTYKELFDFKTAEKTDWNDLGLFDYTKKGINATKKATNPKNLVPPKPRVQTPKKVVVKPAAKPAPVNNNIPAGWEISPGKIDRNGNPVLRQIRKRQFGGNLYNWF